MKNCPRFNTLIMPALSTNFFLLVITSLIFRLTFANSSYFFPAKVFLFNCINILLLLFIFHFLIEIIIITFFLFRGKLLREFKKNLIKFLKEFFSSSTFYFLYLWLLSYPQRHCTLQKCLVCIIYFTGRQRRNVIKN